MNKQLLYIVAIDDPNVARLQVQYMPLQIQYNRKATVKNLPVIGRNEDLKQFSGGNTDLNFSLTFYAVDVDGNDAMQKAKWLESMTYRDTSKPPSRLKIIFGDVFKDDIWVLKTCNETMRVFQPANNWMPRYITLQLQLTKVENIDKVASQIRNWTY